MIYSLGRIGVIWIIIGTIAAIGFKDYYRTGAAWIIVGTVVFFLAITLSLILKKKNKE
jgi:hypothetical protein